MGLEWMAWTWQTALVFIFVFGSIAFMGFLETRNPGGAPRDGILGLRTTRGDRLFISRDTVKTHVSRVYRKLGVHSRQEAVTSAERRGILHSA